MAAKQAWRSRLRAALKRARPIALLLACICVLESAPVRADRESCIAAHEAAQLMRLRGRYTAAREQLLVCVQSSCPALISDDCIANLKEVDASLPSVVFAVVDDQARDLADVQVYANDTLLTQRLDGRAIPLDPGVYTLRFTAPGYLDGSLRVTIHEAQKQRLLRFELTANTASPLAPPADSAQPSHLRRHALGYGLAGGALAALASGVITGAVGKRELGRKERQCEARACSADDVARGKRLYIGADIAFGVAGALAVAATWLFIVTHRRTQQAEALTLAPAVHRSGAGLTLHALF